MGEDGEKGQENYLQKEITFVFNFAHMGLIILSRTGLSEEERWRDKSEPAFAQG